MTITRIASHLDHSTRFNPDNVTNGTAYRIDCDPGSDRSAHYLGDDRTLAPYWVDAARALVFATYDDAVDYARARLDGEHAQYSKVPQSRPGIGWRVEAFDYSRGVVERDVCETSVQRAQRLAAWVRQHGVAAWPVVTAGGARIAVQSSACYRWDDRTNVTADAVDLIDADLHALRAHMGY